MVTMRFHFLSLFLYLSLRLSSSRVATHTFVYVCVTYLRSLGSYPPYLSLSPTVTVTNDALSIRIVRREGENGEHLLAPYPSWRRPYELLRSLPYPFPPTPAIVRFTLLYKLVSMRTQSAPILFQDAMFKKHGGKGR